MQAVALSNFFDFQSQSNPLNWIAIRIEQSNNQSSNNLALCYKKIEDPKNGGRNGQVVVIRRR